MNFRRYNKDTAPGFQMAPMVDVIFLLLIFFIAASIYAQWESKMGIKVPVSKSGQVETRFPGEVIINIDREGKIFMNYVNYTPERLEKLLGELAKTYPDQPVIIRADKNTAYEHVIGVLDICKNSDIYNISFATITETDQKTPEN